MKNFIIGVVIIGFIALLYMWFNDNPQRVVSTTEIDIADYFQKSMFDKAVLKSGGMMPIEGYDSGLLLGAFPGLVEADFEGVETFEGHYEMQGQQLVFERDVEEPISTAERTVSDEGYETLLDNLTERLNIDPQTEEDIDDLIDQIS